MSADTVRWGTVASRWCLVNPKAWLAACLTLTTCSALLAAPSPFWNLTWTLQLYDIGLIS